MPLYLDACALAKRYMHEGVSTKRMLEITGRHDHWGGFVVSSLIEPEVISAFAKYARSMPAEHQAHYFALHPRTVDTFRRELSRVAFTIISVTDAEIERAADFLRAAPQYSIGAADAIHLMTALQVREDEPALVFVTADKGLQSAAAAAGLPVYNPQTADVDRLHDLLRSANPDAADG